MKMRYPAAFCLTLGLLAPAAAVASSQGATPPPDGRNVTSPHLAARPSTTDSSYWTPARMKAATPLEAPAEVPASTPRSTGPQERTLAPATQGEPITVMPAAGSRPVRAFAPQATGLDRPYDTGVTRTNAAVFFTQNGDDYLCSGTVVNSPTKNMVSTAGHCVADGSGGWSENVVVVPGFSSDCNGCGDAPYGVWTGTKVTTTAEWFENSNVLQDYAYIVVRPKKEEDIVERLGGRGSKWNLSADQRFRAMGYPAAAPFDGFDQELCTSRTQGRDDPSAGLWAGPRSLAITCDMTGGSSGGSWNVARWNKAHTKRVLFQNGLNSYKYLDDDAHMYGPYFGKESYALYSYTVNQG